MTTACRWLTLASSRQRRALRGFVAARSRVEKAPMSYSETLQGERTEKTLERGVDRDDVSLVEAVAERSAFQDQLYVRYRRPLLQVFLHRRIDRAAAEDLLQRTFLQVIKKIRAEGLEDPSNL